ncbi:MAG: hypothetical protein IIY31_05285, partial [Desulfovibrio sp.]|nr:hypothetical protein [Desulfovibrio sp.]
MMPPRLLPRLALSLPAAVFAVCTLCALALQPAPACAVPKLDSGLATVQDRMRGLLNSVEIRLQRRPPQMEDLEARERLRPLRRSDRVGRASYGAILDDAS